MLVVDPAPPPSGAASSVLTQAPLEQTLSLAQSLLLEHVATGELPEVVAVDSSWSTVVGVGLSVSNWMLVTACRDVVVDTRSSGSKTEGKAVSVLKVVGVAEVRRVEVVVDIMNSERVNRSER